MVCSSLRNTASIASLSRCHGSTGKSLPASFTIALYFSTSSFKASRRKLVIILYAILCLLVVEFLFKTGMFYSHYDIGEHLYETAIAVIAKRSSPATSARAETVLSFSPRLRIVSIMPGIDTGAPERTETSSGSFRLRISCRQELRP